MEAEHEILDFIARELNNRGKTVALDRDTPILTSQLLDSLFLVDLIVFLEGRFESKTPLLAKATKADLDSVAKISDFLGL